MFRHMPRVIYRNNQIVNVVCQLRFPTILSIGTKAPDEFQDAVRKEFPRYETKKEQPAPKLVNRNGMIAAEKQEPIVNHCFISEDGEWQINLTSGFVALSSHSYTDWETFARKLDRVLAEFSRIYEPAWFELVGLRYVNAFSREDWEDPFCVECRRHQRDFFAYKQANPRKGDLQKDLAVIYGNHEFFLWHTDDRIAELPENNDWDQKLWGKWEDNRHHKLWRAIDAWLPLARNQHSKKNVLNLDLFSGTPYGAVDVIPYENAYTPYRSVALLGWNTCEAGFAQKLRSFVEAGGQAFVSRCHFNTTDRCDMPFVYDEAQIALLLGSKEKTAFAYHEDGSTAIWQIPMGTGILYYGTYADYTCTPERMEAAKAVLRAMGEAAAQAVCDNPNIFFTLRETEGGQRILDVLNVCPNGKEEAYTIRLSDGRTVTGTSAPGQIQTHILP